MMPTTRRAALVLISLALALSARAPAVLRGHHDRSPSSPGNGDGYATDPGRSYTVAPDATFDGNRGNGLYAADGTAVTVLGAAFRDNGKDGLLAGHNATVTIKGGAFSGNGDGLAALASPITVTGGDFHGNQVYGLFATKGCRVTVSGGHFTGNGRGGRVGDGLLADDSRVTVSGGDFSGNALHGLFALGASAITVSGGTFTGNGRHDLAADGAGASLTLIGAGLVFADTPSSPHLASTAGTGDTALSTRPGGLRLGVVTGTLRDNAAPSRISFVIFNGAHIRLVNAPRCRAGAD